MLIATSSPSTPVNSRRFYLIRSVLKLTLGNLGSLKQAKKFPLCEWIGKGCKKGLEVREGREGRSPQPNLSRGSHVPLYAL